MSNIWVTSDLHIGHDREFVWSPRGFTCSADHDESIVEYFNNTVNDEDDVYILGDLMLGDNNYGIGMLKNLKGRLHIVRGNHDTNPRWELYKNLPNVVEMGDALRFKSEGYNFYCSHYPTITSNFEKDSLKQIEINLYGHTHQQTDFYEDRPFMFHCGVDSLSNFPINIEMVINRCKNKVEECIKYL